MWLTTSSSPQNSFPVAISSASSSRMYSSKQETYYCVHMDIFLEYQLRKLCPWRNGEAHCSAGSNIPWKPSCCILFGFLLIFLIVSHQFSSGSFSSRGWTSQRPPSRRTKLSQHSSFSTLEFPSNCDTDLYLFFFKKRRKTRRE